MKKISILLVFALCAFTLSGANGYTADLAGCKDFATHFSNTCDESAAITSFANVPTKNVSCLNNGKRKSACNNQVGNYCQWERKLCVKCFESSNKVYVRVQTNGLPSHCYRSPKTAPQEQTVDYTVRWMAPVEENSKAQVSTQDEVNNLICDILGSRDQNIPRNTEYQRNVGRPENTAWGVATTGVLLFTGISAEGIDPFYPAAYNGITDPSKYVEKVDWCLAHPQITGIFHYHSASTCLANATQYEYKNGPMNKDIKTLMQVAWKEVNHTTPAGISKDGRPIRNPYKSDGTSWSDCEVDVCNGVTLNGNYMYTTTFFHPYIMGCYGQGSNPTGISQQCSSNPRKCTKSSGNTFAEVQETTAFQFLQ